MAQRNAFKSDSSFFRMLAVGAVGAQAVQQWLNALDYTSPSWSAALSRPGSGAT